MFVTKMYFFFFFSLQTKFHHKFCQKAKNCYSIKHKFNIFCLFVKLIFSSSSFDIMNCMTFMLCGFLEMPREALGGLNWPSSIIYHHTTLPHILGKAVYSQWSLVKEPVTRLVHKPEEPETKDIEAKKKSKPERYKLRRQKVNLLKEEL